MSSRPDGGPAFPRPFSASKLADESYDPQRGMSLRDYFAAKAMEAMMTNSEYGHLDRPLLVFHAYQWADAMVAERVK